MDLRFRSILDSGNASPVTWAPNEPGAEKSPRKTSSPATCTSETGNGKAMTRAKRKRRKEGRWRALTEHW